MPIQTRGFSVDVMPRFTPADANLLALNPNQFTQGVLSAYQVEDAKNKIEENKLRLAAQKKLQDELDALSQKRMKAQEAAFDSTIAKTNAEIPLFARRAGVEGLELANKETSLPVLGNLALATMDKQAKDIAFAETQRPTIQATQEIANKTGLTTAPTKALAEIELASNEYDKAVLQSIQLADAVANAPEDSKLKRAKAAADIKVAEAQAKKDEAMAANIATLDARAEADRASKEAQAAARTTALLGKQTSVLNTVKMLEAVANDAERMVAKINSERAIDPGTNQYTTFDELERKYFTRGKDGSLVTKKNFWGNIPEYAAIQKRLIERDAAVAERDEKKATAAMVQREFLQEALQSRNQSIDGSGNSALIKTPTPTQAPASNVIKIKVDAKGNIVK